MAAEREAGHITCLRLTLCFLGTADFLEGGNYTLVALEVRSLKHLCTFGVKTVKFALVA